MNNSVIVPVDDSPRSLSALDAGQALAAQMGLTLQLFSVVSSQDAVDKRRQVIETALGEQQAQITVVVDASPADALLKMLNEGGRSICCMATHARGAVTEMVLGSVAKRVVEEYAGQVVLVGPKHAGKWRGPIATVMACVDGSPLSEQAIAPAAGCAARLKATLLLIQVLDPDLVHLGEESGDTGEWVYLRRTHDELRREKGIAAEWEVLHGKDAATAITDYADTQPGSLIVLTSHGRSGVSRLVMGSVAQSIVHQSSSPVWIIRPQNP